MTQERTNGGWWVGVGATVAALLIAFQSKPATHTSPAEGSKPSAQKTESLLDASPSDGPAGEGPLKPIWDFFGPPSPAPAQHRKRYAATLSPTVGVVVEEPRPADMLYTWPTCRDCDLDAYAFRFLIATVPDPADSGFPSQFDQTVEALQRALEVDDYVIDRAWLPWRRPRAAGKQPAPRLHESHPGLILFRSTCSTTARKECPKKQGLLALLLVGETATAGIHKAAFDKAVQVICDCPAFKTEGNRIRVIGPHFSGSATSLGLALRRARPLVEKACAAEPRIKVVCGSASGFDHAKFVKSFDEGGWVREQELKDERAFETTILPDTVVFKQLLNFLGNPKNPKHGTPPAPVVVLYEANTGFGQFINDYLLFPTTKRTQEKKPQFALIPYPLHISQLRASYTREQLARLETGGLPRVGRDLPFPSEDGEDRQGGHEAIHAQSPLITAAVNDLVLDNLVLTMAKKKARHVCLFSTDPQDTIFLARLIRNRYPDVQLLTVGGDLLYTHEDYNSALRGMILASTYPLSPGFQRWSDLSDDRAFTRILFSYQAFQGCYNAALVHLAGQPASECAKKITDQMMDYGWKDPDRTTTAPPIWISVVGGNGELVPVRFVPPKDYCAGANDDDKNALKYLFQRDISIDPHLPEGPSYGEVDFPNMWFLLFVLFLAANAWCFVITWKYLRDSDWTDKPQDRCCRYKQRIDFGVICLAQILLYGEFAVLTWTPLRAGLLHVHPLHGVVVCLVCFASLFMMVFAWWRLVAAHRRVILGWAWRNRWEQYTEVTSWSKPLWGSPDGARWWCRAGFWLALSDILMLALVTLAVLYYGGRWLVTPFAFTSQDVIDFERLVHLSNGVSPLLPRVFFCAALFGWGAFLVKKLYLANHYAIGRPFPWSGSSSFKGLRNLDRDVRSELMPPSTFRKHFGWCFGAFLLAVLVFAKFWDERIPPIDGTAFGTFMLGGFSVCSFLLLFTLLQFHFAWRALRKMLRFLALVPIQGAFERLSDKVVSTFAHYLFSLRPRHSQLAISVQQFHQLRKRFPAFRAELQRAAQWGCRGNVEAAALRAAWSEVQRAFPGGQFGPAIPQQYEKELDPVGEQDQIPPHGSRVPEWGGLTGEETYRLARHCLRVLRHFWPAYTMEEAFGRPHPAAASGGETGGRPERPTPLFLSLPEGNPIREWIIAAQDFAAMEVIRYLSQFIVQLRNLLNSLTVGSLLLILAAAVYPFYPQHQLLLMLTVLGGTTAAFIVAFLVQLNRDELVSRITRSTPNRFTPDLTFLHGTVAYVLPIVGGLMLQFPFLTSALRSLFDPLFHILP